MSNPILTPHRKDEQNLFGKDPCSPSAGVQSDYTRTIAIDKMTFLLNNLGDRIAEQ